MLHMMKPDSPKGDVGVLVGRFQVHELHDGHRSLIETVLSRHTKLVILLGSTPGVLVTRRSPLDFQTRRAMIQAEYPNVTILPIRDMPSDEDWSKAVDDQIASVVETGSVILYGSRDGFIPYYSGRHHCTSLESTFEVSGTAVRNSLSHDVRASRDFRHGVVYAAFNRHPAAFPTVDIALVKTTHPGHTTRDGVQHVALVRQATDPERQWRFPGGFVDPTDESLEQAALRELYEETGAAPGHVTYIGSRRQDSWRYRNEIDTIHTTFFLAHYQFGPLTAGDDATDARWASVTELDSVLIPEHQPLGEMLIAHLQKEQ